MLKKVTDYCVTNGLICNNDKIVAGISGGADSMCLLFVLHKMQALFNLQIAVVHVNHQIRSCAGEDASYVEQMCKEWEIPYFLFERDVSAYAKENHLSQEEAGREIRYQAFDEILQKHFDGTGKIAVAHNQNDRAETVLFHLFRGTGIKGLSGISNTRDNIIRPILCLKRQEIEDFLQNNHIDFCIDYTNGEDTYTRNRIRKHVLKYAEENITNRAVEHVNEAADLLEETQQLLVRLSGELYDAYVIEENRNGCRIKIDCKCLQEEPILVRYMIMKCMTVIAGQSKDITSRHVYDIFHLLGNHTGKQLHLPYGVTAYKEYGSLFLQKGQPEQEVESGAFSITFTLDNLVSGDNIQSLPDGREVVFTVSDREKSFTINQKTYTKCFDYDKITKSIVLRYRETGDYLTVDKRGARKTLKQYLINEKVPAYMRDTLPVLAEENHVLWVVGMRISEYYKVTEGTKRILQVQIRGGAQNGRDS